MVIVYAVKIVVFVVPTERREKRTVVHPGHIDAIDANLNDAQC